MSRRNTRKAKLIHAITKETSKETSSQDIIQELPQKRLIRSTPQMSVAESIPSSTVHKISVSKDLPTQLQIRSRRNNLDCSSSKQACISLYLTSLPKKCSAQDLFQLLSEYGEISEVIHVKNSLGDFTGSGIVKFRNQTDCMQAFCRGSFDIDGTKVGCSLLSYYDS